MRLTKQIPDLMNTKSILKCIIFPTAQLNFRFHIIIFIYDYFNQRNNISRNNVFIIYPPGFNYSVFYSMAILSISFFSF